MDLPRQALESRMAGIEEYNPLLLTLIEWGRGQIEHATQNLVKIARADTVLVLF